MSSSHEVADHSPAGILGDVVATLRSLTDVLWSAHPDTELVTTVEQITAARAALAAVEAGVVAEADARGLAKKTLAYGSTGDWLTHLGGLRRGEGKRVVARANALTGPLTHTHRSLAAGVVSPGQVDILIDALDQLPPQTWTRRRAEKLMLTQARYLDATELTRTARHLVEVIDPEHTDRRLEAQLARDERDAHHHRFLTITEDQAGGVRVKGRGTIEDGALLKAALLPLTRPQPATPETSAETRNLVLDPRDHGARLWDALIATAHHALTTHLPPETHGARPRLLITLDHHALTTALTAAAAGAGPEAGAGVGTTGDGLELPPGVLRRLACDADLIPVVLGTHSEVLDLGRTRRLVTPPIWTALIARDHHCTFPACTRPPVMCHAHHLTHWADGGPTTLDNLTLLCGHHHRLIHHTAWHVRLNPTTRHPEYQPPPKPGTSPTWITHRPRRQ